MDQLAWLDRARAHIFSSGIGDAADRLGQANMTYGLASIHHLQRALGLADDALFVGAPDATVTRNRHRWGHGFGYGGVVMWSPELAILGALPNGCGMLVGGLRSPPSERGLHEAAAAARTEAIELEGCTLTYDLSESNHFVDACELEAALVDDPPPLPPHLFVIHSSGHEHRGRSPWGPGLYLHLSEALQRRALRHDTPWGEIAYLRDGEAADYYAFCQRVQGFNQRRRARFGDRLFGDHDVLCNATHQGFRAPGRFHLGCYWFDDAGRLYPLTLGPDQPIYLLRPRPNFSEEAIARLGWSERADALGLRETIRAVDLLPHGGGYAYPQIEEVLRVEQRGGGRRFFLRGDEGELMMEDIRALPFVYRDLAVLHRLIALDIAEPVARYRVRIVLKE